MTRRPARPTETNPPPLTVAASVVAVEGVVLLLLAALELGSVEETRRSVGLSTAGFFAGYGVILLACAWGLWRRHTWSRGPVLFTQLVGVGLAWNARDQWPITVALLVCVVIVFAGMLNPATLEALDGPPSSHDQASGSSD